MSPSVGLVGPLLSLALLTLLSEDVACVTAGLLVAAGRLPFPAAAAACAAGILSGDLILFGAGWLLVSIGKERWLRRIVRPERLDAAVAWTRRRGALVALTSRLLPGTRTPVYIALGMLLAVREAADPATAADAP